MVDFLKTCTTLGRILNSRTHRSLKLNRQSATNRIEMELKLPALTFLLLAIFASIVGVGERQLRSFRKSERKIDKSSFDYFVFVQQWPGSFCDTKKGCCFPMTGEPGPFFGIHGLWPNRNDGTHPSKCSNSPFDPNELVEVVDHLHKSWGTLACASRSNEDFWKHEWSKHGTCSGLTQRRYFQRSLELYKKYDIAGALRDAGILPDDRHYPIAHITSALTAVLGFPPQIVCNKDPDGNQQLHEVRICVAADATTLILCPPSRRPFCAGSAQFPLYRGPSSSRHTVSSVLTDSTEL